MQKIFKDENKFVFNPTYPFQVKIARESCYVSDQDRIWDEYSQVFQANNCNR